MIGQVIAPILGPIAGGFISAAMGWRWVFWTLAGAQGVLTITMFVFMRETYHPLILQRRVRRLRKATGDNYLQSQLDRGTSPREHLKQALVRPLQMLFTAPIVLIIALYSGIIYGFLCQSHPTFFPLWPQH
jgi:MFS family permease